MKIYEIVAFNNFYSAYIAGHNLSMAAAYKINKIIQATKQDLEFYQTELQKIFSDCVEQEDGQYKLSADTENYVLKKDKTDEFEKRYIELRNVDVNFDDALKLDIEIFDGLVIPPEEVLNIMNFIK